MKGVLVSVTYPNLRAEMARRGIKPQDIADHLGMTVENVRNKINGKVTITLPEMKSINTHFFPDLSLTLDYLFATEEKK